MDVVIFEVTGQRFALPASSVSEVLDPLFVTPLPYAPDYVDGLVNVAGLVVVQMDAAVRLGLNTTLDAACGSVLVIGSGGADSAVHVEKVLTKASIEDSQIALGSETPIEIEGQKSEKHFLAGEFQWQGAPVLLLDAGAFSLDDIVAVGEPVGGGGLLGSAVGTSGRGDLKEEASVNQGFQCVIVICNGERYGIHLSEVGEVVDEFNLTTLPHAPIEVSGMALLRGAPLLGLSLGIMLGGSGNATQRKMVVVEKKGVRFGLLVEEVAGINLFADGSIQQVENGAEIDGYLISAEGGMIGLLNLEGLITEERFERCRNYLVKNHIEDAMAQAVDTVGAKIRLLTFSLGDEQCAIPLNLVERVEEYRSATGIPGGEASGLAGAVQIQGEVAPVIDLRREMGVVADDKNASFLVVRMDGGVWALTVNRVERVIEIPEADIEPVKTAETDYIGSVGRVNGKLISILTLEPLKVIAASFSDVRLAA